MARTTKLTTDTQRRFCKALADGNTREHSAMAAGVTSACVRAWIARAKRERKGIYVAFLAAVKKAEADAITRNVGIVQKAGRKVWTASAWWLERRYPADYGRDAGKFAEFEKRLALMEAEGRGRVAGSSGTPLPAGDTSPENCSSDPPPPPV